MLTLKNVSKKFGSVHALKDINIEFKSGLNFIVGPSGSGKSTLLKLISGIDKNFEGEIFFNGNSLKEFNSTELNNYYYNSIGFVWQNFQLINHLSVEDNVKLVLELSPLGNIEKSSKVKNILNKLGLTHIAKNKVSNLSGGQKQRVAIARALIKEPEIIIADEPTGALDKKSSQVIMDILKKIAKERLVIVVTHDKSLIDDSSSVFTLKDGELVSKSITNQNKQTLNRKFYKPCLSIKNATIVGLKNFKGMLLKFTLTSLILMLSSYFLLLNFSRSIGSQQDKVFKQLMDEHGNTLLDIGIVSNFSSASGVSDSSGNESDVKKPKGDVNQDISKIFDKYVNDKRIQYIYPIESYWEMEVSVDGLKNNYKVPTSGTVIQLNDIVEGRLPNKDEMEVVIPKSLAKKLTSDISSLIGKEMTMKGSIVTSHPKDPYNEKPTFFSDNMKLKIVGILDNTMNYDGYGKVEPEDQLIYSMKAIKQFREKAGKDMSSIPINLRAKDLQSVIEIVDELSKDGIVAIGAFEQVKDIIRLNSTTSEQSGSITAIIGALAVIVSFAITLINSYIRKSEYSILKMNGFSKASIFKITVMEYITTGLMTSILFVIFLPLINMLSTKLFDISLSGANTLFTGISVTIILSIIMGIISSLISSNINVMNNLKTGDR